MSMREGQDEGDTKMKKLLIAAALTTLIATPSFAAWNDIGLNTSTYPVETSGAQAYASDYTGSVRHTARVNARARGAYAAAPGAYYAGPQDVVVDGQVVGADPDANVRLQLRKDADAQNY
jgi:hypothetical protein